MLQPKNCWVGHIPDRPPAASIVAVKHSETSDAIRTQVPCFHKEGRQGTVVYPSEHITALKNGGLSTHAQWHPTFGPVSTRRWGSLGGYLNVASSESQCELTRALAEAPQPSGEDRHSRYIRCGPDDPPAGFH